MAGILTWMSSLLSCLRFGSIFAFLLLALCGSSFSSLSNEAPPEPLEPGFLFFKLLQQYSKVKTQLILCSLSSSLNAEGVSPPDRGVKGSAPTASSSVLAQCGQTGSTSLDSLRTDSLIERKISGEVVAKCKKGGENLVQCLAKDAFINKILGNFVEGLRPGIARMCCLLDGCGVAANGLGQVVGENEVANSNACLGCLSTDTEKGGYKSKEVTSSADQWSFFRSLSKMFCTDTKYNDMPCSKLNLVALNILSGPAEKKFREGAADILKHCYPTFAGDSLRLFQSIAGNLSVNDTSRIKALLTSPMPEVRRSSIVQFLSGNSGVTKQKMGDLTARAKTGLVIMGILVTIGILLGVWVVYQRARLYFNPHEAVRYSQISINDIYIDDPNPDEDENEDDGDPGEGVPTPYHT
ncbi:uncharacterized protein LOC110982629 [Acanthaster planci]|uniref:Uncharacterized protein LOC110982629 n=1 Tax=Acanthaster planci TaxID=133434 RepID=A0A8B7YUA1_ACAPL|nr:uncharacterized protein LOC110982629 [Acanthaster planci]